MTTYKQLQRDFEHKVKVLQESCPHKKSEWRDVMWAPGHYADHSVKVCKRCNKTIEKKKHIIK